MWGSLLSCAPVGNRRWAGSQIAAGWLLAPLSNCCLMPCRASSNAGYCPSVRLCLVLELVSNCRPVFCVQAHNVRTSWADGVASECMARYPDLGMRPLSTASQAARRTAAPRLSFRHSEKFKARRPFSTSSESMDASGSTWLYQGHFVWLEWQSPHARRSVPATSGGVCSTASMLREASTGGFVCGARTMKASRHTGKTVNRIGIGFRN